MDLKHDQNFQNYDTIRGSGLHLSEFFLNNQLNDSIWLAKC